MLRYTSLTLSLLFATFGCYSEDSVNEASSSAQVPTSGPEGPMGCRRGTEDCPCAVGECDEELVCVDDFCRSPPEPESTGVTSSSSGGDPDTTAGVESSGTSATEGEPVDTVGHVAKVVAGDRHTCALTIEGGVRCWGLVGHGQLGYPRLWPVDELIGDDETPASVGDVQLGANAMDITVGWGWTCALLETGGLRCWGIGDNGFLGYGNEEDIGHNEAPSEVADVPLGGPAARLKLGLGSNCAVLETGAARCWGIGGVGALGYGNVQNIGDDETPESAGDIAVGGPVAAISSGSLHTCALLEGGSVRCWGAGANGKLGYAGTDTIGDDEVPMVVGDVDIGGSAVQVVTGLHHTCALLEGGDVRCWGSNEDGAIGTANFMDVGINETPGSLPPVDIGGPVVALAAGSRHTCAILEGGNVRCWGRGEHGRLGYGNIGQVGYANVPADAGDVDLGGAAVQISAGDRHTCVVMDLGAVRCWGDGSTGQLGYPGMEEMIGDDEAPRTAGNVPV